MTSVEDELRDALRLLEQRAPQLTPDMVLTPSTEPHARPAHRWLLPLVAAAAVLAIAVAVVATWPRHSTTSPSGPKSPLATCGTVPSSHGPLASRLRLSITGTPVGARSGFTIRPKVRLSSVDAAAHRIDFAQPAKLVIVQNGRIVGASGDVVAGTGLGAQVGARGISYPAPPVVLSGCPDRRSDPVNPGATRKPLPAGTYQLVAIVSGEGRDASTQLVSPPTPIMITATSPVVQGTTTCLEQAPHRPGADTTLVPGSPTSVTICQYPKGHASRWATTDATPLVAALNALPTSPIRANGSCRPRFAGALPARGTYELHFHYLAGPDVVVNVVPECRPSVNNSISLQADGASTIVALLEQLLPPKQELQYQALAIKTGCVGAQCGHVRSPHALASLVHATACVAWQLNPGSHGGPQHLIRLLVPSDVGEHDRSSITQLPGVHSVDVTSPDNFSRSPAAQPNFPPPTPVSCD